MGSLLGGIISILGVVFTIRASFISLEKSILEQNKSKFLESISYKIKGLYKVKSIIYETDRKLSNWRYGWNDAYEKTDKKALEHDINLYFFPKLRVLIEDSLEVDYEFFRLIEKFVKSSRSYIFNNDPETKDIMSRLYDEIQLLIKELEIHEARLLKNFEKYSNDVEN